VLEGTNAFAASYYFNYLMFLLQQDHGFSNLDNLALGAVHGFLYVGASWFAGRFGQRHGYFTSLRIGFGGMAASIALAWLFPSTLFQVLGVVGWTVAVCFTWPMLEALVSEGEPPERLPRRIGIYNVTWASAYLFGFFLGGSIYERLGQSSLYWLPIAVHVAQFIASYPLQKRHASVRTDLASPDAAPGIAEHAGLGIEEGGRLMSAWFIVRTLTFAVLWAWHGWHYRIGWFLGSFLLLILGFVAVMTTREVWMLIVAQIAFGWGTGLIYYSSLFYAMDGSETHGEHGGIHEAFIGLGMGSGPAISALTLWLSGAAMAPAVAVGTALVGGWAWCWQVGRGARTRSGNPG